MPSRVIRDHQVRFRLVWFARFVRYLEHALGSSDVACSAHAYDAHMFAWRLERKEMVERGNTVYTA